MANLNLLEALQNALEKTKTYIDESVNNKTDKEQIGELSNLQTTDKTNIVNAINELFQNANNGKEIIADAIGGELQSSDTFAAMGNKIDDMSSILSAFITNNGGTVAGEENLSELLDILYTATSIKFPIEFLYEAKQIACGYAHAFILKNDGTLWACGNNSRGQLGLGNTTSQTTFTQVTVSDVKDIVCGFNHTYMIKNDGTVWACGDNGEGQLGQGQYDGSYTSFVQVTRNVSDVKDIICGGDQTFMLKNDGTVWATGSNYYGGLGIGTSGAVTSRTEFTQVTTNISDVKEIVCGQYHNFMLKNDGTVWSCGYNYDGQLGLSTSGDDYNQDTFTQVTRNVSDVKQIVCGDRHTYMLKNDGTVWSCGENYYGQLGLGNETNHDSFTQVTVSDVKNIICGANHTYMLKNDGTVWSCGYNESGQLGLGTTTELYTTFTQVTTNASDVKDIVCGGYHTYMIKNDGTVWATGNNEDGQLGLGTTTNVNTFTNTNVNIAE